MMNFAHVSGHGQCLLFYPRHSQRVCRFFEKYAKQAFACLKKIFLNFIKNDNKITFEKGGVSDGTNEGTF